MNAPRHEPIILDRLSALTARGYGMSAHCLGCERRQDLDLPAIIERHGDLNVAGFKDRCSICGRPGSVQVHPPMPTFTGYPR